MENINLTPREAAARLRVHVGTMSAWRCQGVGPKYIKNGKKILYPMALMEAYEKAQTRQNTSA